MQLLSPRMKLSEAVYRGGLNHSRSILLKHGRYTAEAIARRASALRADQDGAGYPRRAQRTALEAPKRTAFKPRSAPSSGRALLAVERLLITRRQCSPSSPNPGAAWLRSNLGRAAGALDCPGGAQDADRRTSCQCRS